MPTKATHDGRMHEPNQTRLVILPESLTAENGAKYLLIGDFKESLDLDCSECDGSGIIRHEICHLCEGTGMYSHDVVIEWSTIKQIYNVIVKNMAIKDKNGDYVIFENTQQEMEKLKKNIRFANSIIHNKVVANQSAWLEWKEGRGAEWAMTWIENGLANPGFIPENTEKKTPQEWFDSNVVECVLE